MSRHDIDYSARISTRTIADGINPDVPIEGYYRHRIRTGGVAVGVRIWWGPPIEPWTGEEMDRAPRWNATVNGKWIDVERVWPACSHTPIDQAAHDYLISLQAWGAEHGHEALADPRKKLDALSTPMMF